MKRAAEVTHYQGLVDWQVLSRLVEVVYFKVSDGLGIDLLYKTNLKLCPEHIEKRYYHFYRSSISACEQVSHFIKTSGAAKGSIMAVDVEKLSYPNKQTGQQTWECCDRLSQAGYGAMIYSNPDIITRFLQEQRLHKFKLWIAHWGTLTPRVPLPWFPEEWDTWQFAVVPGQVWGTGLLNGRYPKIDLDVVKGQEHGY